MQYYIKQRSTGISKTAKVICTLILINFTEIDWTKRLKASKIGKFPLDPQNTKLTVGNNKKIILYNIMFVLF